MSIMSDVVIKKKCVEMDMIVPFQPESVKHLDGEPITSMGLSSFGYDVTLGRDLEVFSNINSAIIDPLNFTKDCLVKAEIHKKDNGLEYAILPPNSYLLGHTVERFKIPKNVLVVVLGKSTYARTGVAVNVTPIEPEFEGQVVIEIANQTTLPVMIYVNAGIAQFVFLESDVDCEVSYKDRAGKYQGQSGIQHAKV